MAVSLPSYHSLAILYRTDIFLQINISLSSALIPRISNGFSPVSYVNIRFLPGYIPLSRYSSIFCRFLYRYSSSSRSPKCSRYISSRAFTCKSVKSGYLIAPFRSLSFFSKIWDLKFKKNICYAGSASEPSLKKKTPGEPRKKGRHKNGARQNYI